MSRRLSGGRGRELAGHLGAFGLGRAPCGAPRMRISLSIHATTVLAALCAVSACRSARAPGARSEARPPVLTSASSRCADVELTEGLDLVVLGSGGPRSRGRAGSSYLVGIAGKPRMLVDVGPGSYVRLGETGLPQVGLDTILLTHLHVDHAGDLPGIVKSRDLSAEGPVSFRVFGPTGRGAYPSTTAFLDRLFGPRGAFAYLPSFRNPIDFEVTDLTADVDSPPRTVLEEGDVRVSSVGVDHGDVPTVAYRIDHAKRSVVISGDLASTGTHIGALARGADVLVYDTAIVPVPELADVRYELHTVPRRIGQVAAAAGVETLVLSHVSGVVEPKKDEVLAAIGESFTGEVRFASDCMHLPLADRR